MTGRVEAIHITEARKQPLRAVPEARAIPATGLAGDRYSKRDGSFKPKPGRDLTLIEAEALEALSHDYKVEFLAVESRRNVLTRGIALNHLVGREFQIGNVRVRGAGLCEPCTYLEGLTGKTVREGLIHRGGLRAEILTEGTIRVGDTITA
jgi:MOSC domain-containing protein YiiM